MQVESVGVAKVLQSEKNTMEILNSIDVYTPEKRRKSNKNAQNRRIGGVGR